MTKADIKILVVDDEKILRMGICRCVESAGFSTIEASNGESALELLSSEMPALVILDVMMEGLSGLEVCQRIRENENTKNLKVLFLSARGQLKEQIKGMEAGGDYYMTKPFNYKELIKVIHELLELEIK